jgi:hypothetical protein
MEKRVTIIRNMLPVYKSIRSVGVSMGQDVSIRLGGVITL